MADREFHLADHPLVQERLAKLERLRALGVDPFGRRFDGAEPIAAVRERCVAAEVPEEEAPTARVAGRVMRYRDHGKALFLDLLDRTGRIQVYLRRDRLDARAFAVAKLVDLGDHLGVAGAVKKTRKGEVSVFARELTFLGKALLPPPEKWHGLRDVELRYRERHVDLFANPEVRRIFLRRSAVVRRIRSFLDARGFLEVETPMMQPLAGGAAARPFATRLEALKLPLYLRVAPELYLKRLLVGGLERVYELNRCFRNEGLSPRHNPEFTMLEVYQAYGDYEVMMELTEELVADLVRAQTGGHTLTYQGRTLDFTPPWRRVRYRELFAAVTGIPWADREGVAGRARELEVAGDGLDHAHLAHEVFERLVEPTLVQPTFVHDYPTALCPLAKVREDQPEVAERFELFAAGMELANAFTELNDPVDQEARFRAQVAAREAEGPAAVDYDSVRALAQGMPPAGGLGVGIDRLVMVLTDAPSIKEVILFPFMRPAAARV